MKTFRVGLLNGNSFVFFGTASEGEAMGNRAGVNWIMEI